MLLWSWHPTMFRQLLQSARREREGNGKICETQNERKTFKVYCDRYVSIADNKGKNEKKKYGEKQS